MDAHTGTTALYIQPKSNEPNKTTISNLSTESVKEEKRNVVS